MDYKQYLSTGLSGYGCNECGANIRLNGKAITCADCGAVICEDCVTSGKVTAHQCEEDDAFVF